MNTIWLLNVSVIKRTISTLLIALPLVLYPAGSNLLAQSVPAKPYILVLGIAQDGGFPHAGCNKTCCKNAWTDASLRKMVSCLALVDPAQNRAWIFDATPDFATQWKLLQKRTNDSIRLEGVFLSHALIGHYTGLMQLGREVMNAKQVPVYAMPRMKTFLENNGPWSQLVSLGNISIREIFNNKKVEIASGLSVIPLVVPHRDEYSETIGFRISLDENSMLFIPDIDKWEKWEKNIIEEVRTCRHVFIDGTFHAASELPGRSMKEVPHPLVTETMAMLKNLDKATRQRVHFIHLNHTNPLIQKTSTEGGHLKNDGFKLAEQGAHYYFDE